jgi:acyl-CoA dehydrogenase family protein 9
VLGEVGEGKRVLQSLLHRYKYMVAAGVVASLRTLLNETIKHTNSRKQYGLPLSDFSLVKHQLAQCAARIYSLESMVYMTAALEDVSDEPDVEVESVIVKQYAAEASDFVVKTCLSLLGIDKVNQEGSLYQKYLRDNQLLQSWQGTANINKCFIGVSGIIHMNTQGNDNLQVIRQPALHPIAFLKYMYRNYKHRNNNHPLDLKLNACVHPRLIQSADKLEWAVLRLPFIARDLIIQKGANIQLEEKNLERLADMVMEIYAMTCVISRSSRSYCVGHAHAEHEINLAVSYIHEARLRVNARSDEMFGYGKDQYNRDG